MGYVSTRLRAALAVTVLALTGCPDLGQVNATDGEEDTGTTTSGGDGMMTITTTQGNTITATGGMGGTTDTGGNDTTAAMDSTGPSESTTGTDTGMGTGQDLDCCTPHDSPSCDDETVAECVCARSAFCCAFEWDAQCVDVAENECGGCGMTDDGTTAGTDDGATDTGTGTGGPGTCCDVQPTPGCSNSDIETCVCALDAFCCDNSWDGMCVGSAVGDCGANCPTVDTCCTAGPAGCAVEELEDCVCAIDADCCMSGWDGECVSISIMQCDNTCPDIVEGEGDCCEPNGTPGCDDQAITQCRCAADPFCCDQEWDQICINGATADCGAGCELPAGPCCLPNGTPGCEDMAVQDCTCMIDSFCCDDTWDGMCVDTAETSCMLECDSGDCCEANGSPGCNDDAVEDCTCMIDPFCCDNTWDGMCVGTAVSDCMLECPQSDCCEPTFAGGCTDMAVQDCTCMLDAFCCDSSWDGMCVATALSDCMLDCPTGDCCEPTFVPGCSDMAVQDCTCMLDAFCCDDSWDGMCVQGAIDNCMLDCSGDTGTGDSGGMPGTGSTGSTG